MAQAALQGILEDAQSRLAFRIQASIEPEIADYSPSYAELDYPRLLEDAAAARAASSISEVASIDDEAQRGVKYIVTSKTTAIISRLSRIVPQALFESLSQEVISGCLRNLLVAASMVGKRSGEVHARLFLLRNYVAIRRHLAPFNAAFAHTESLLDFNQLICSLFAFLSFFGCLLMLPPLVKIDSGPRVKQRQDALAWARQCARCPSPGRPAAVDRRVPDGRAPPARPGTQARLRRDSVDRRSRHHRDSEFTDGARHRLSREPAERGEWAQQPHRAGLHEARYLRVS